jgi:hypothetical protein
MNDPNPLIPRRMVLAAALAMAAPFAYATEPFTNAAILLLQPEEVIQARIKSTSDLAKYMKDIEAAAGTAMQSVFQRKPVGGFVVVALKPPGRSKAWLDLDSPMPEPTQAALRNAIESVPPPKVQDGIVVFAFKASLWGGRPPTRAAPAPEEWKAEAARHAQKLEVGALVEQVWK